MIESTGIDYDAGAMEKPSDHRPVWINLAEWFGSFVFKNS